MAIIYEQHFVINKLVTQFSELRLKEMYASAEEFNDECIKFVVCRNINAVLDDVEVNESKLLSRDECYILMKKSKLQWLQKHNWRGQDDIY
jgi:hypothetical protein